jgi:NADPH2:quinone reductase
LKHISLVGVHWGPSRRHELETVRDGFRALAKLYQERKIAPMIWKTFQLEQVAEALALLGGRQSVGKIVLKM